MSRAAVAAVAGSASTQTAAERAEAVIQTSAGTPKSLRFGPVKSAATISHNRVVWMPTSRERPTTATRWRVRADFRSRCCDSSPTTSPGQKQVRKQLHPQANCSLISPHLALLDALDQAQVGSKVHSSGPRGVRTETTLELALLSPGSSQGINALRAIESPRADPALQVGLH